MVTGNRVAIVGFGKTGKALLDFFIARKLYKSLILYDDEPIQEKKEINDYKRNGVEFIFGDSHFNCLNQADIIILSPGVNGRHPRFNEIREKGKKIVSEIEFASNFIRAKIVAVTGTNGKSTTASLINHILKQNSLKSILAGNIGVPFISEIKNISADSIVVLELSSFQLEEIVDFKPHIAILLNISPDHLDRYPSLDDYISAKLNICKNQGKDDYLILNHNDQLIKRNNNKFGEVKKVWFSISDSLPAGAFFKNGFIDLNLHGYSEEISLKNNNLCGLHNLENIMASIIVARLLEIPCSDIENSLADFDGLPHRMELVGNIGAVEFINDSKATNVDAVLKSVNSINENLVLILGGKDKGSDFTVLENSLRNGVERILVIGAATNSIYEQLKGIKHKFIQVRSLKEAVESGYEILKEQGGIVLLAPGCASFDMFDNFEQRGKTFEDEFRILKRKINNG